MACPAGRPPPVSGLAPIISRLLVAYAADHGIDLFATIDTGIPQAGG
jgi:hypothetical protein